MLWNSDGLLRLNAAAHGSSHDVCGAGDVRGTSGGVDSAVYSDENFANRDGRDFMWGIAHAAVSPRPPISLYTIVARTHTYTHAANVWALSIVQGPFSVARAQTLTFRFATFASLHGRGGCAAPKLVGVGVPSRWLACVCKFFAPAVWNPDRVCPLRRNAHHTCESATHSPAPFGRSGWRNKGQ
jgi:hypothetical protein